MQYRYEKDMCAAIAMQNLFPESGAIEKQKKAHIEDIMLCELYPVLGFAFEPVVAGIYLTHQQVLDCLRTQWATHAKKNEKQWIIFAAMEHTQYGAHFVLILRSKGIICEVDALSPCVHFEKTWQWHRRANDQARQFGSLHQLYDLQTRRALLLGDCDLQHLVSLT